MKLPTILIILLGTSVAALAQSDRDAKTDPKQQKTMSVTGCLEKSADPTSGRQFVLKSGEMAYELDPGSVNLDAHVGHKVTVSGDSMKGRGPHDDDRIHVTKLAMVSTKCP